MARTQGFDTAAAVRSAREVFWESGYEDAAIPALERATGLNRSSIYNAFGSKRGLFDAAVESYLDEVVRPMLRPFAATPVAPDAIVVYLGRLRSTFLDSDSPAFAHGCLLINSATSPIARDAAVREVVAAYREELRAAIGRGVLAHRPTHEAEANARLADACTAMIVAAFALARVDTVAALQCIDTARRLLDDHA
ncbi:MULTISPECIES: TetR/AcrR family transcriptional regulator [unclassified Dietzia]|uniref:TetR/AcrR family transcriptional regulator n=1 Tax=unclassified Dietzia TaxID=2617939 RepID=UPI000D20DE8A|nr:MULTISPECIES: TetR/AcrR family transcriptional regulator [unclassified Dietzia]AVZ39322.1 TetR/AcrR family transcriptional regulator [Dietzia sp. JS16-p6b]QGW24577.1 regulatory protein TetR [Dietzia sp. DQ12-45-1b]